MPERYNFITHHVKKTITDAKSKALWTIENRLLLYFLLYINLIKILGNIIHHDYIVYKPTTDETCKKINKIKIKILNKKQNLNVAVYIS